ncbi:MAG: ABC transporter ATP-binding protein [Clostridia bacterium]|nr:ABC transporter ATP-binding protein [Clostridia bacterium]
MVPTFILRAAAPYVSIYFSSKLIDALATGAPLRQIILYTALTVGLVFLAQALIRWLEPRLAAAHTGAYYKEDWMRSEKAMSMDYACLEDAEVALLRSRIGQESRTGFNLWYLQQTMRNTVSNVTNIICSIGLSLSFFLNPAIPLFGKLGLVGLLILTVCSEILCTAKSQKAKNEFLDACVDINRAYEKYEEFVGDYERGKDTRLYGMRDVVLSRIKNTQDDLYKKSIRRSIRQAAAESPKLLMEDILRFLANLLLIWAALQGAVSVGAISMYVSCIIKMIWAISELVKMGQIALLNHEYLERYFSYFDIPNRMYEGSLTVEKRDDVEYDVEFRDVSFKYPHTEEWALRHVNLKFKVGEKLAVVGMNGSGKTTFIKLLCRLYDPTEGEILLNGVDIKKYDYDEYMSIFSVVFQDFTLFAFTLGQNVAASGTYDQARAEQCLRRAGFGDRLDTLTNGTETYLYKNYSPDGIEISGGEAQKIALARALYKDAPFIILDEPTAALDPVSEYEVYRRFNEIATDKTTIYISHRLASCRFCDTIAVFDHGSIVQIGDHSTLLQEESGKYHELWHAQAQYYTE